MKKVLIVVLGISFCFLFLITSFEYFLRAIPNDFNTKQFFLNKNRDNIQVLILGSSHAFVGINPNELDQKAFNLAYSSQTLDLDEKLFNRYKNELPQLKTVIIPVSYFSYVLALEDGTSNYKIKDYNIYYGLFSHTFQLKNQFEIFFQSIDKNLIDLKRFNKSFNGKITIDSTGFINKRYIKPNLDWEESAIHATNSHSKNMNENLTQKRIIQNQKSLENIIAWCQKNQVQVILVSSPTTDAYVQKLDMEQFDHWRKTTKYITDKYSNVIWLNFLENNQSFTKDDFQNADHLSEKGAAKMTRLINQYL